MPSSTEASFQPRLNASCIDTFMPWPALALCVWHASPAMKTRGIRDRGLIREHVVEAVGDALADLVDDEPGNVLTSSVYGCSTRCAVAMTCSAVIVPQGVALGRVDVAEIDVQPHQVAALARDDQQDVALVGRLDRRP